MIVIFIYERRESLNITVAWNSCPLRQFRLSTQQQK